MEAVITLKHKAEFEALLASYQPSAQSIAIIQNVPMAALVGPFGAGKNAIIHELTQTGRYHFLVSDTTRPPKFRNGAMEQHGVQYFFRPEEDVLADIKNGAFIEAAVIHGQQVSGTSVREIEAAAQRDQIALAEIEVQGVANIKKIKSNAKLFFIVPPDFDTWLTRVHAREQINETELLRRFSSSIDEFTAAFNDSDYMFIVNDNLQHTVALIDGIMQPNAAPYDDTPARAVAKTLFANAQQYLAEHSK